MPERTQAEASLYQKSIRQGRGRAWSWLTGPAGQALPVACIALLEIVSDTAPWGR